MIQKRRRRVDHTLLMALACGSSVEQAASRAGVGITTVRRRLKDPRFTKRLQEIRADMVQRTAAMLTAAAGEAVKTLLDLQKASAPPAIRLGAARAIIELGGKLRETAELADRIAALEQQLANEAAGTPPPIGPPPVTPPDAPPPAPPPDGPLETPEPPLKEAA
jgi:autotransporter translocation and assembly factor TamB